MESRMLGANRGHDGVGDEASVAYVDLSTKVVRSVVVGRTRATLPSRFQFCEIASGPPTWSVRLLEEFPEANGVVVGATDDPVEDAVTRRSASVHGNRLQVVPFGLAGLKDLRCGTFDLTFALDHVLDVVEDPRWILDHIVRITKPGGLVISLVRNLCDAVSASLADARVEEAEQALTGKGKCIATSAELNLFTSRSIEELVKAAGARPCATLGVPVALPPRRLDVHGRRASSVFEMLSNCESLERILRIERALLDQRGGALRGSHLLSIAVVPLRGEGWGDFWQTDLERDCSRA